MKTAILLGAGSSLPAEFPSTRAITDLVLSGEGVWRHSDGSYFTDGSHPPDHKTRLANRMVIRLYAEVKRYYLSSAKRPPNYEDLQYIAGQVYDEETGEMDNPAVRLFSQRLRAEPSQFITRRGIDWGETLSETFNYIADIVWRQLCGSAQCTHQLELLARACDSGQVTSISTLCHDTHVEKFLVDQGILLADGFSKPENNVRYWNADLSSSDKLPFLKLHGSVDWFRFRPDNRESFFDDRIGIPLDGDHHHTKTDDGIFQTALDGRPLLLIGTFNKIPEYTKGIFPPASLSLSVDHPRR